MRRTKYQADRRHLLHRLMAFAIMLSCVVGLLSLTVFAQNSYVITDGDNVTVHKSFSTDPDEVLVEVGIELSEEDTYTTTYNDGVSRIDIQRMQLVTVIYQGERSVIGTYGETVGSLLRRMGITLADGDVLSCEAEHPTFDGLTVEILHREIQTETYEEIIPYTTNYFEDPKLGPEEALVLVEGVDGTVRYTAQVVYENGVEVSRQITDEEILTTPVTCLIVRGSDRAISDQPDSPDHLVADTGFTVVPTEPAQAEDAENETLWDDETPTVTGGLLTTSSGTTYEYIDTLQVSCTAYSCGNRVGYTYTGTVARVGAVAVDPTVIPLGTKMYIVSNDGQYIYGYCVAEDIGGGIKGNKIDLYFDTFDECWQFGVRPCTVYILG